MTEEELKALKPGDVVYGFLEGFGVADGFVAEVKSGEVWVEFPEFGGLWANFVPDICAALEHGTIAEKEEKIRDQD